MAEVYRLRNEEVYEAPESELRRFARFFVDSSIAPNARLDAGVFDYPPGAACHEHVHEQADEIYFVLQGELRSVVNGLEHRIGRGDLLYIHAGEVHVTDNPTGEYTSFFAVHVPCVEDYDEFRRSWPKRLNVPEEAW
ncbi:MAG: cupin domain-containing protein [Bacillota bacterium]|jgi:mannose-6-phosphate isomerase-like protein (cupin superfamily)